MMPNSFARLSERVRLAARYLVFAVMGLLASPLLHAATVTYYYTDPQGTPLAIADANGNILKVIDQRPFGGVAMGQSDPIGMTGHVADVDSGLVYMQARYYDPTIARFLSADPVTPFQNSRLNFQRYSYAADNPFAYHDPTGKQIHADQPDVARGDCAQAFICGEKSTLPSGVQLDAEEYASSHVAAWLRSMWRGQAAHKVIEADLKRAGGVKGYEVEVEHSFETAAGGRLRIDVMMRKSAKEAWSIFEIKPANDKAASAGYSQVTRYDSEMSRAGEMSKVGSWSYFFSEPYRSTTVPSIVIGPMDFGGTYIYGPDESWRGVITYQTADSAPHP